MKIWLLFIALFLISSCGFKKLSYRYADWYMIKKTYKYLGEKEDGKEKIEPIVKNFLKNAENKDVPKLIAHLKEAQKVLTKSPIKETDVGPWIMKTRFLIKDIVDDYMLALLPFIKTLSAEDIKNMQEYLNESNQDAREKFKNPEERIINRFEKILGSVNEKQTAFIKANITSFDDKLEDRMKNRIAKQKEFIQLIKDKKWKKLERFLKAKFFHRPKDYIQRNQTAIAKLLPALNANQINHLKDMIKDYIDFLEWVQNRRYYQ